VGGGGVEAHRTAVVAAAAGSIKFSVALRGIFDKKSRNLCTSPVFDAPVRGFRRN